MPYRCPCGSEFDPWDHVCPRCGGALDIEVVRAPVRMTCERGHVAFRETGAHHPCPVCNALLREASPAEPGQDPPAVAEPRARSQESDDRRKGSPSSASLDATYYASACARHGRLASQECVEVIDDDQGQSKASAVDRGGLPGPITQVALGAVGAVGGRR